MFPAVLNVQQDPHEPWFFIALTAPCCYQFQISGTSVRNLYESSFV